MTTNKQRREAERRRLQRQLEERREREASRKTATLVASIIGTLVVIAAVIAVIVVTKNNGGDTSNQSGKSGTASSPAAATTPAASSTPAASPSSPATPLAAPVACTKPSTAKTVQFQGVSVLNPTDLKKDPKVRSTSSTLPKGLLCDDLVLGKGKPATTTSSVTVQYSGVLYKNGTLFDSSWSRGQTATFTLGPGNVIDGFTQGIAGQGKAAPMREGGRRIIVMPSELAYRDQSQGGIPANSPLVFVVDLVKVNS